MLVIRCNDLLQLGVHQVRQRLGGGVKRNRFQLAISSTGGYTLPALPEEERQLKLHAGYSPHSNSMRLVSIANAYHALKKLKVLSAGGEAAFQQVIRHGVKYLTPVPAQHDSSSPAGASPGAGAGAAAAAAAAAPAADGEEAPPPAVAVDSSAAAAAGGSGRFSALPTINMSQKQLQKKKYGLATVAPHLLYAEPLAGQRQVGSCAQPATCAQPVV